jgi:large subunit ribosomal protein L18e
LNPLNPELNKLIDLLRRKYRENRARIWRRIAEDLNKSKRSRVVLNVGEIAKYTSDRDTVAVPGKVLGSGTINHKVTVAAFKFSPQARKKIEKAGGKCIGIAELIKENPKGTNVKLLCS